MTQTYNASDIEVLSGLEPVRRRPGMYTDTTRPNHLAHEVIDNSVDEALSGHCQSIAVVLHKDGSLEVSDDGRGMPVDIHPQEKVSGVELILTRLHAGGKFSNKSYDFSGGLHGVGVSVVNALSRQLECWVRRGGKEYNIGFRDGRVSSKLEVVGSVGQRNTGTTVGVESEGPVDRVQARVTRRPARGSDATTADPEGDLTALGETTLRFDALARALTKKLRMLRTAIAGGGQG